MTGYDCAKIPSPSKAADSAELVNVVNGFCGGDLGTAGTAVAFEQEEIGTTGYFGCVQECQKYD